MHRQFSINCNEMTNTFLQAGLCLVWAAGLSLGFWAETFHGDALIACVRLSTEKAPDWFGCLSVSVLPLLISACAVYFFFPALFPLCFFRGMLVGLGLWSVNAVFGSAGAWMAPICLFGLLVSSCVLMWFCCRRIRLGRAFLGRDTLAALVAGLAVSGVDMALTAPFLGEIMNF